MKRIIGVYNDETVLLNAIDKVQAANIKISDVITPFAIEEVFEKLNIKTHINVAAFFYALFGGVIGVFLGLYYTFVIDYPLNIGGKPSLSLSFVILMFVGTILVTVSATLITFFIVDKKGPGAKQHFEYPGITDDIFLILVDVPFDMDETQQEEVNKVMMESGAIKTDER